MDPEKKQEIERWLDDHHLYNEVKRLRAESNPGLFPDLHDFMWWLAQGVNIDDNMLNELLRLVEEADLADDNDRLRVASTPVGGYSPAE